MRSARHNIDPTHGVPGLSRYKQDLVSLLHNQPLIWNEIVDPEALAYRDVLVAIEQSPRYGALKMFTAYNLPAALYVATIIDVTIFDQHEPQGFMHTTTEEAEEIADVAAEAILQANKVISSLGLHSELQTMDYQQVLQVYARIGASKQIDLLMQTNPELSNTLSRGRFTLGITQSNELHNATPQELTNLTNDPTFWARYADGELDTTQTPLEEDTCTTIILVDSSGSMNDHKISLAKAYALTITEGTLQAGGTAYIIIHAGNHLLMYHVTPDHRMPLLEFAAQRLTGTSEHEEALNTAAAIATDSTNIFIITDDTEIQPTQNWNLMRETTTTQVTGVTVGIHPNQSLNTLSDKNHTLN